MTMGSATIRAVAVLIVAVLAMQPIAAQANDMTAREVTVKIFEATEGERADLSDMVLTLIDLSGLDFKKAILIGADLYGSDLSNANLSGTDLSSTRLDRATIIGADFSGANLTDATLLRPSTFSTVSKHHLEIANFTGAKLVRAKIDGRLTGTIFRAADLTDADFGPTVSGVNRVTIVPFNVLSRADFTDAILHGAILEQVNLEYTIFRSADLRGADFSRANLYGADFTGADVTGANFTGANVRDAVFSGAKGVHSAKGLDVAGNPEDIKSKRP